MIAKKYIDTWRATPDWSFEGFAQQLRIDTNMDAILWQYYRARKIARNMIKGTISQQYAMLRDYYVELLRMNLGSTILDSFG